MRAMQCFRDMLWYGRTLKTLSEKSQFDRTTYYMTYNVQNIYTKQTGEAKEYGAFGYKKMF